MNKIKSMNNISIKNIALISGIGYLIIFITGFFSNFFVLEPLIISDNIVQTVANIKANISLFKLSIISFILMVLFDLILTWSLYLLLKNIHKELSLLTAWLRLVNVAIFGAALFFLVDILSMINNVSFSQLLGNDFINANIFLSIDSFNNMWLVGLVFFGFHLLGLAYLIIKSGFVPKLIGILLLIAGIGYITDSFAHFVLSNYENYKDVFSLFVIIPGTIGEFSLTLWLLTKGRKR